MQKNGKTRKLLYELAGLECARIPFCLTVEAEAMGCKVDLGGTIRRLRFLKHHLEAATI